MLSFLKTYLEASAEGTAACIHPVAPCGRKATTYPKPGPFWNSSGTGCRNGSKCYIFQHKYTTACQFWPKRSANLLSERFYLILFKSSDYKVLQDKSITMEYIWYVMYKVNNARPPHPLITRFDFSSFLPQPAHIRHCKLPRGINGVCPVMDWWPVQGLFCLDCWDVLHHPHDHN